MLNLVFCKYLLAVHKKASNMAVYGELGRYPLILNILQSSIKYFNHMQASENTLLKESITVSLMNDNSWAKGIEKMIKTLCDPDFNISTINDNHIDLSLVEKAKDKWQELWKADLARDTSLNNKRTKSGNKLRTYNTFKKEFDYENYLNDIPNINYRKCVTRLRISAHKLAIETGRHARPNNATFGIPVEKRICGTCNIVEDERHFLTVCEKFRDQRNDLINKISIIEPKIELFNDDYLFIFLITATGNISRLVANFIKKAEVT